jgi:hypothetical protein
MLSAIAQNYCTITLSSLKFKAKTFALLILL